jgi:multiple sugar transport system permease protein
MQKTLTLEEYSRKSSRTKSLLKKYGLIALFVGPFALCFIFFFLYPLVNGLAISLTNYKLASPGDSYVWNEFRWYKLIFDDSQFGGRYYEAFWRSFVHTIVFAVIMVPIAILVPLGLAILIKSKPPGYKVFRCLVYMPSIVPLTAAGAIFAMVFLPEQTHGLLASIFPGFGPKEWSLEFIAEFTIGEWTWKIPWAWIPIFIMCFWGGWGGNFLILSAGLENIPKSLYEAADIDGCSKWKKIRNVTLPGIKGQLVLTLFTTIIGYMGLYGQNYVLFGGGPSNSRLSSIPGGGYTSTLIYFIQDVVANNADFKAKVYGLGAAASIIFALFVGVITGIQMFCTREKKTGLKYATEFNEWKQLEK